MSFVTRLGADGRVSIEGSVKGEGSGGSVCVVCRRNALGRNGDPLKINLDLLEVRVYGYM